MQKLLDAYRATATFKLAQKIRSHERKHQMATCLLSKEDSDLLADAIHHANTGDEHFYQSDDGRTRGTYGL
jgi:hypothetical protein